MTGRRADRPEEPRLARSLSRPSPRHGGQVTPAEDSGGTGAEALNRLPVPQPGGAPQDVRGRPANHRRSGPPPPHPPTRRLTGLSVPDTKLEQAYPAGFCCGYRRVVVRQAGKTLEVQRWAHNGTSWVSLHGELTGWTIRAIVRVLRSEDRSTVVVVNAAGLTTVELPCLSDLQTVCAAITERGVSLALIEAPRDLMQALAMTTDPPTHPG